jgi:hypothetical protein
MSIAAPASSAPFEGDEVYKLRKMHRNLQLLQLRAPAAAATRVRHRPPIRALIAAKAASC